MLYSNRSKTKICQMGEYQNMLCFQTRLSIQGLGACSVLKIILQMHCFPLEPFFKTNHRQLLKVKSNNYHHKCSNTAEVLQSRDYYSHKFYSKNPISVIITKESVNKELLEQEGSHGFVWQNGETDLHTDWLLVIDYRRRIYLI